MQSTLPTKSQYPKPSLADYERFFSNSIEVVDFMDQLSTTFPDYVNHQQSDPPPFHKKKSTNQSQKEIDFKNPSELEKKIVSELSIIQDTKKHLIHPFFTYNSSAKSSINEILNTNLSHYVKTDLVDGIVDSTVISTLLPFASPDQANSVLLNEQINKTHMTKAAKKIADSEKVQKLVQKRIFLLSIGQLRPTPAEVQAKRKKKLRFPPANQINLKGILKTSNHPPMIEQSISINEQHQDNQTINQSNSIQAEHQVQLNSPDNQNSISSNCDTNLLTTNIKKVHFVPAPEDKIPAGATIANSESLSKMKKILQKEAEIRKHDKELMTKIKIDSLSKPKPPKSKYFTTSPASTYNQNQNQSYKIKPKQRRSQSLQRMPETEKVKLQTKSKIDSLKSSGIIRKRTTSTLSDDPDFIEPVMRRRTTSYSSRTTTSPSRSPTRTTSKKPKLRTKRTSYS